MAKNKKKGRKKAQAISEQGPGALDSIGGLTPAEAWNLDPYSLYAQAGDEATLGNAHPGTGAGKGYDLTGLDFDTLRAMARVDVVAAIIGTRVNQCAAFCEPQEEEGQLGYKIQLRDKGATPTKKDKARAKEISDFIYTCGREEAVGHEIDFESFTRMVLRDSLEVEQGCFEIVRTRRGDVAGFIPVDAATIRRAKPTEEEKKEGRYSPSESISFVQIIENRIVASWSSKDLIFGVRRPRSAIHVNRYGFPELEELAKVLTSILHAEAFNSQNFTHGLHAAGILAVKTKMNPKLFRSFRRNFYAMMSGAYNAKRTPIIQLDPENNEELQSINLSNNNREMEFKEWLAFLQKITCAIYQIDPAELGFVYGNEGQSSSLSQQGPEARVQFSKEKGLRPLLRAYAKWLNRGVVHQIDDRFELVFVGLEEQLKNSRLEQRIKKGSNYMTINEIRALDGLEPIDNPAADMIMNASYMQAAQAAQMQEDAPAEEGAAPEGGQGEPPAEGEAPETPGAPTAQAEGGKAGEPTPSEKDQGLDGEDPFAAMFKSTARGCRRVTLEV